MPDPDIELQGDVLLATLLDTVLNNKGAGFNPYLRPGVKAALAYLNDKNGGKGMGWQGGEWKALLP